MASIDAKNDLIAAAVEFAATRLEPALANIAGPFIKAFYAHVPPDDVVERDAEQLCGGALSVLRLGQTRTPGVPALRVFNPDVNHDGWRAGHTVIEIVTDDMPFLVDSMNAAMNHHELTVHLVIHPIVRVVRGSDGVIAEAAVEAGKPESMMQIFIDEVTDQNRLDAIRADLLEVLADIRAGVEDWPTMRTKAHEAIDLIRRQPPNGFSADDVAEAADFLAWVDDNHFTFLGYQEYRFSGEGASVLAEPVPDTALGLFRPDRAGSRGAPGGLQSLPPAVLGSLRAPALVTVTKAATRATVHRSAHMDYVGIKVFDEAGQVVGERRFIGLFTSVVYHTSPRRMPLLRRKLEAIVGRANYTPGSHDEKALLHILETFPRDELFQIDVEALFGIAIGILHLQERQRVALFVRQDPFERFVSCFVYVPRDRYDTALRLAIGRLLADALDGSVDAFRTEVGEDPLARIHFIVKTTPGAVPAYDVDEIERRLAEAARTWGDRLRTKLIADNGEERGLALYRRYGNAFPVSYRERFNADAAVGDVAAIEGIAAGDDLALNLYRPMEAPLTVVNFKVYHRGGSVPLSDILPFLEKMGLVALGEIPFPIQRPEPEAPVWIHDFQLQRRDCEAIDLRQVRDAFHDSFRRLWQGEIENDGLNQLVLEAGLSARQVVLLRCFARYLRQAGAPFSLDYMEETLGNYPKVAADVVALFEARFDPHATHARDIVAIRQRLDETLEGVESLDEDRILRRFLNLAEVSLRTNYYQRDAAGQPKPYLSVKFDSRKVEDLPLPRPMFEITVYSPRMEGIHLRGGKVARGGIRWSDRREDFRTEILGLMKAQMVKNTVIVPLGAKGGFVVKRPPAPELGRQAWLDEGIACYKMLIGGMLDVTDNLNGDEIVPPADVVRYDDDDPYIVAAADKGTATFSDIANGVAGDYGFWLGDAFASGGSAGYDHKGMGITARGAWESVKRHFREMGHDTQSQAFTTVGCGDMGGDVFGNGMLLSPHIRLVGAFNHLHIFVDPNPDAAQSFAERQRLFDNRGGWDQYDRSLLSGGGAIFERSAKSLTLSPEIQAALDFHQSTCTPNELIHAMLQAPVDLLWFGGIGTYIKAEDESNASVGDRANDALRVNGEQVRAKVVGEGANLGCTQLGRVEYAKTGGRINTDFIDNSAGVDTSDHEVNLKILLGGFVQSGDMTEKQRNALLEEMTDDVATLVLRNNYLQGQALTRALAEAAEKLPEHRRFMRRLERDGRLARAVEFLPDEETLEEMETEHHGLTRPELCVLLSYAKLELYDEILGSDLPDDPQLAARLVAYFPPAIRERYAAAIPRHRLAREIVTLFVANQVVDRAGITFVSRMKDKTGRAADDVARAYRAAVMMFDLPTIWEQIEDLDNQIDAALQTEMLSQTALLAERTTLWFLRHGGESLSLSALVERFGDGIAGLRDEICDLIPAADQAAMTAHATALVTRGAPQALADRIAALASLDATPDIVAIANDTGVDVRRAAESYLLIGQRFHFNWARTAANRLEAGSGWERLAVDAVLDDLNGYQAGIARMVLANGGEVTSWIEPRARQVERLDRLAEELSGAPTVELAMLTVFNGEMRAAVG